MFAPALLTVGLLFAPGDLSKMERTESLAAEVSLQAQTEIDICGYYRCEGDNPDGRKYRGVVRIEKNHDAYSVTWLTAPNETGTGIAIRKRNQLSVSCLTRSPEGAAIAVVVYEIQVGPRLVGRFTELGGNGTIRTETLTYMKPLK